MHARAFENLPTMNAMALGFWEESRNGHRIIGHGGDTAWFHSHLHLIPDAGVGFFVSYNSLGKGEISPRDAVWYAFLDRYFPYELPAGQTIANADDDARLVAGRYLNSRGFETNIMRALTVVSDAKVSRNDDGTISLSLFKDLNGQPKRFKEIAPLLYRDMNGQARIAFKRMSTGELRMIVDWPGAVFRQAHGSDDSLVIDILLVSSLAVLALTLLVWPIGAWIRWHYAKKLELSTAALRYRLLTRLTCAFDLVLVIAFALFFSVALSDTLAHPGAAFVFLVRIGQLLAWVGVLGVLVVLYNAYVTWAVRGRWVWSKLGYSLTALACVGFSWFALAFHFLGWNLKY
jgi:hypothetical protein